MEELVPGNSALVIFPPNAVSLTIDKWRCVYDPNQKVIPPHITVAYPPFITEEQWLLEQKEITTCLRAFKPFMVTIRELGYFKEAANVLWLKPEDGENLQRVHSALQKQFPKDVSSSRLRYVPHVTIGFFESERALLKAKDVISAVWKPIQFVVDEILFVVLKNDGIWHIEGNISLKSY